MKPTVSQLCCRVDGREGVEDGEGLVWGGAAGGGAVR